jgi:hypothetical protein
MFDDISFTVFFFESLASQESEKKFPRNVLHVARPVVIVYQWPLRRRWKWILATATTCCKKSMMGPLWGAADGSGSVHHRVLKMTSK